MGTPEQARIADSLSVKFRDIQKLVNELNVEATLYQSSMRISDDASRRIFQALTRMMAITDQVELSMNVMREDLRVVEMGSTDSATALWREYIENAFDEHGCVPAAFNGKVH